MGKNDSKDYFSFRREIYINFVEIKRIVVEKHFINGREIIIIDQSRAEKQTKDFCRKIILQFCAAEEAAKLFPVIYFEWEDNLRDPLFHVSLEEMMKGRAKVFIVLPKLEAEFRDSDTKKMAKFCESALVHEFAHLQQNLMTNYFVRQEKAAQRLKAKWNTLETIPLSSRISRFNFREFLVLLLPEGIATFCERYRRKEVSYSEEYFQFAVRNAALPITVIKELLELLSLGRSRTLSSKNTERINKLWSYLLRVAIYDLGFHMVYSILYVDHEAVPGDIINYDLFEFIKKYEDCIIAKGYKPLISATSGRGEIDYKKILAQLAMK